MPMKTEYFSAFLSERLEATDVYLPLSRPAEADLVSLLPGKDDYIFLTLKGDVHMETVKARNENGTLIIERGVEGTEAVLHHYGTCVVSVSPTVVAVMKDLICNYSCCEDGDCPCVGVAYAGAVLPEAHVGKVWEGSVVFAGDAPIKMGIDNAPDWMNVSQQGGLMRLYGTPAVSGTVPISVSATNCNGTQIATKALELTVTV